MASQPFVHTAIGTTGLVAAGAKVYCYVKDTVTPQTAYMNSGLSTPAANPYIADSAGHIQFYFSDLLNFTFLVKSSDDADTLLEVDFTASGTAFSITYADLGNLNAFNDAWAAYLETIHFNQIWLGAYDGATAYVENDAVSYGGSSYICTAATTGNLPTNTSYWDVLAEKGDSAYQVAVDEGFVGTEAEWLETLIGTSSRDEQVFSGDAIDTTFVFTGMVITDKLNISIFVDGIIQRESDYGLSNDGTDTTITFTSAPPAGTNNIVMRGAVLTGGGSGTGDVVGPASVTDGNLAAFDGVTGKLIKQLTATQARTLLNVADGATAYTDEMARDALGAALTNGTGLSKAVNDAGDTITFALSFLGIEALTDPNADRIAFWDDSAGAFAWLTLGTNLSITGTTINATSGSGSGDLLAANNLSDVASVATAFSNIKQAASDTATGVVELATDAETETGTDTARAVTPANVTASYIKKSLVTTRGDIITRGASAPQRLALGASGRVLKSDGTDAVWAGQSEIIIIAVGDETTAITTGTAKVTFRMPFAMTLTAVRASLTTVSSSGIPTVDINEAGVTILSTKLTIDASEKTSTTAATAAVISDTALADDAEITIDIDVAGTGAAGLKVMLIGVRA